MHQKIACFLSVFFFSLIGSLNAQDSKTDSGWIDLYNGKDLTGWTQKNGTATYTLEDGGVICGTTAKGSPNSFLCTDKEYGNFELTFETKVSDELNSGVQIRSQTKPLNTAEKKRGDKFGRVNGPQVEVEASGGTKGGEAGYIYGEAAGGWLIKKEDLIKTEHFKNGQWNSFRVLANGPNIQTWINGQQIANLTHKGNYTSHPKGFIGLQVHGIGKNAGPFQARWKNIKLRTLPDTPPLEIAHSFITAGRGGISIVDEDGKTEWHVNRPASDVWMLETGNVLAAIYPSKGFKGGGVPEIDRETKKIVWKYVGTQKEISTVQKIGDDEYLVAELGANPRAITINRAGEVLSEMAFDCQKANVHMQTRMLRALPNGNYIAPHLLDFAVKEYKPKTGKVIKEIKTDERGRDKKDWPFTAIRLKGGNTLIGCTNGNRVIEVDRKGEIVWSVDNDDLGESIIDDACGVQRLPSGNTVITSYHAKDDKVKLFEVTPDKKIVWKFTGLKKGIHHFQILTTNGDSLPNALK